MMGLASGMDTDFIIQQTLRMHQFKIDNQMRNRKLIEWRQQTHTGIKDEIQSLRTTFLSNLGSKTMMNRNTFNATKATATGANTGAVTIRTNAGSPLGNFSINSVTQLAKGAHLTTASGVSANNNGFATGARLGDIEFANGGKISWTHDGGTVKVGNEDVKIERVGTTWTFKNSAGVDVDVDGWDGTGPLTIKAGGTERTLNWNELTNRFTEDVPATFRGSMAIPEGVGGAARDIVVTAQEVNGEWRFSSSEGVITQGEDGKLSVKFGSGDSAVTHELGEWDETTKTLEGTVFTPPQRDVVVMAGEARLTFNTGGENVNVLIRATDSLSEMITRINNEAGVNMKYDRLTDQFTLEARTGTNINPAGTQLGIYSDSNFFNLIRGDVGKIALIDGETGSPAIVRSGQQAIAIINNEEVRSNTNNFDYRGVGLTLNETFSGEAISVNLVRDSTPAFNAIKEFIDSYNSIIKRLEGLLNERKTGNEVSYKPLTDEEKQGMTDRQIDEWEAIARKGILRNDQGIQNLVSSLRRSFFEEIEGVGLSPSQIGLTTGSYFDGTGGQIMINEERLREAIESDPDMVADIFIRIDNSGTGSKGVGLLYKIDGLMRDYVNISQPTSTKGLEDSLKRVNEQIERMQARMFAEEDKLYRIFAQMETSMQKLQQQGGWFSAMLGG